MGIETKRPSRLTLDLPTRAREKLETLSSETDQSLAEVIRRALSVYSLLWEAAKGGDALMVRSRDGQREREILLPEFEVTTEH